MNGALANGVLAVLALVGMLVVFGWLTRVKRRMVRAARRVVWRGLELVAWVLLASAITAVQWAIISQTTSGAVWLCVLGLPALLTAAAVERVLIESTGR